MRVKAIQLTLTEAEFEALQHILASSDLAMTYYDEASSMLSKLEAIANRLETARKLMVRFTETS